MNEPLITIFVRHAAGCKYAGDEFAKRCNCRKHFRWTQNGKQYRRKAGTRSWEEAERQKRRLEDHLAGRVTTEDKAERLLSEAIRTFDGNKEAQGIKPRVRKMYSRELKRLLEFSEKHNLLTVKQALTIENLTEVRTTWKAVYPSSYSRSVVQKHLKHFVRFCFDSGWIERIPKLSPIKVDEPETLPLTGAEYDKVLKAAPPRIRTLIKLMRWSGLAIRDASTLKRTDISLDKQSGIYRVIRQRAKTGEHLYIPIPADVAQEVLATANGNPEFVFWNRQKETSSEYRQADYMGECISAAFKDAGVRSAGHMVSHRLRATFAVDLLTKGVPLEHVSKLLGHKSVTTTERHYAKWVKGRQDRLDALVMGTWKQSNESEGGTDS